MKKNVLLSTFFLLLSFVAKSQLLPTGNIDSGLVAYYPFNGNDSDMSNYGNHPIYNSATLTADRYGNPNSAYAFNGTSSYMQIANNPSINFNNQMSLCTWVKVSGFYYGKCLGNSIMQKGDKDFLPGNYTLRFTDFVNGCNGLTPDTSKEQFHGVNTGANPSDFVEKDRWYFLVLTYDGQ